MEDTSGEDLTEFFDDWIYNEGYPRYTIEWNQPNIDEIRIVVNQTQSHPSVSYFEAPVPIRIFGTGGEILDLVLDNTINEEMFIETVGFTIGAIAFDPDTHLISRNNNVTLGIGDNQLEELVLYPNPTNNVIHIYKPNDIIIERIQILDILGRLILEPDVQDQIIIDQLSSGTLFVRIETNYGIIHKRIIKY